ncbi:MAG: hypothetical protein AAF993_11725 [Pseudomonadota bacterium]
MGTGLHLIDIVVVVVVMLLVTWLGHHLSGTITSRRGFFQGDGTLPWWAVSASIVATLVSAVTFVSVPAAVFAPGGDLTYFQVILGLALGKVAVALVLVKPFYECTTATTSYGYIAQRIDHPTGEISMYLGLLLNVINSGVKILAASLVLDVITGWGIPGCAAFIIAISVVWSALAGIKTVIWTDFLLFVLFCLGALFALLFISGNTSQSLADALLLLDNQARLVLFDFSTDPATRYSIWAAVAGSVALNIAQGSAQGTWQRVKACRSQSDAYKAYYFAAVFYVMHLVILAVGLGLVVFYSEQGLPAEVTQRLVDQPDLIFPYFIVTEIPVGVSGLFIAAIFAAAISTLDSALAETSDLSLTHIYCRWVPSAGEHHYLRISRLLMLLWGGVFFFVTLFFARYSAEGLLDLTFKLPNYVYGAIFGSIVLARIGVGRITTVLAGFASACAITAWLASSGVAFFWWCPIAGGLMVAVVVALEKLMAQRAPIASR